eukprot:gnl/TRDRNA2_/TRDRNA2_35671_c0_seq1.p1 gnl/TRDRNA2_/TRDRNA2_35671_c0~~gnl/TRDRNA2_/TRDRNA2_35671_c0_seq1.p1  ORF type:complete len:1182 (+),score=229.14 gnl/TRDRNA2_/TRDRNA2_35671_c0_seq1:41-3586(+)
MAVAPVQIVWSYDTTGSMSSCLEMVKGKIKELSTRLLRDIPGLEIGLIAHGDYCDRNSSYLVKTMSFSSDPVAIEKWVRSVGPTSGGDAPEAYEIALREAARTFAWKPEARKVLALIGDEVPHEAGFPENTDNVDWNAEVERLAGLGVRCFGVQCLGNRHAEFFYRAIAERTDGLWLPMQDLAIIADVFVAVCLQVSGDASAFERFRKQLADGGPVASALVPMILRLAKRKHLSSEELASLCGVVAKLSAEHGGPPKEVCLPVEDVKVSAFVGDGVCEVQLMQCFKNRGNIAGAGASFEYRFALPSGATIFHFEAQLSSGRRIVAVVKGREEARREYRRALARGQKAFLVEQNDADLFTMELGNLDAEEGVQITLRYLMEPEELDAGSGLRLRLPQHVAPRSGGRAAAGALVCCPVTVDIKAEAALGASGIRSHSHRDCFQEWSVVESPQEACTLHGCLSLKPEQGPLLSDLVFDVELPAALPELSAVVEHCDHLDSTMVRIALRPMAAPLCAEGVSGSDRHVVLVLDASASMQGPAIAAAQDAAKVLLNTFAPLGELSFSCLLMRHQVEVLCTGTTATLATEALRSMSSASQVCGGGSNFAAVFDRAAALEPRPDVLVFISDGQGPEIPQAIFAKAKAAKPARIFCLGVGPDQGSELLKGLAAVGRGTAELAPLGVAEVDAAAQRLAADILAEPTEVEISVPEGVTYELWPDRALAYPGRGEVSYLRMRGMPEGGAAICVNSTQVPLATASSGQRLHRLGARCRIRELERTNIGGEQDMAIKTLAVEQSIASSQTSFVAVEEKRAVEHSENVSSGETSTSAVPATAAAALFANHEKINCDSAGEISEAFVLPCASARSLSGARSRRLCEAESDRDFGCDLLSECSSRSLSLEAMTMATKDLSRSSTVFCRSAKKCKSRSFSSDIPGGVAAAVAGMSEAASGITGWMRGAGSAVRGMLTSSAISRTPPQVLAEEIRPVLPSSIVSSSLYVGTISHPTFGPGTHVLMLELISEAGPGRYLGRWSSMGQTEEVVVTFENDLAVTVQNTSGSEVTLLQGEVDMLTGSIRGVCQQGGDGTGKFELAPVQARMELCDTDDDRLVFVRLLGNGVAEYCNGELVVRQLKELHMDFASGHCHDGEGSFTVPTEVPTSADCVTEAPHTLENLESFCIAAGCPVKRCNGRR